MFQADPATDRGDQPASEGMGELLLHGYPRVALREINTHVRDRLVQHLRRRSQRPFRPPEGVTYYEQLQKMGLLHL